MVTRAQLSLYLPSDAAAPVEAVRAVVDPVQHRLIPAHVTLCREHELDGLSGDELARRLAKPEVRPVTLRFGRPEPFHGHGWLVPCVEGEEAFLALRQAVLGPAAQLRRQAPHLTLAHPRNPCAAGNTPDAARVPEGLVVTLSTVRWIEQTGDEPWRVLRTFELGG